MRRKRSRFWNASEFPAPTVECHHCEDPAIVPVWDREFCVGDVTSVIYCDQSGAREGLHSPGMRECAFGSTNKNDRHQLLLLMTKQQQREEVEDEEVERPTTEKSCWAADQQLQWKTSWFDLCSLFEVCRQVKERISVIWIQETQGIKTTISSPNTHFHQSRLIWWSIVFVYSRTLRGWVGVPSQDPLTQFSYLMCVDPYLLVWFVEIRSSSFWFRTFTAITYIVASIKSWAFASTFTFYLITTTLDQNTYWSGVNTQATRQYWSYGGNYYQSHFLRSILSILIFGPDEFALFSLL